MYPWLFLWAPHTHFPFSGDVKEDIAPELGGFFGSIPPTAGDGTIEKAIFQQASYGKQLGVLTEVVLSLVEGHGVASARGLHAVGQLKDIDEEVKEIKEKYRRKRVDTVIRLLEQLRESDPEEVARIVASFQDRPDGSRAE